MTSSLVTGLQRNLNKTTTANGAVTNASSLSAVLDFFALAGALRKDPQEAVRLFKRALIEDKQYAVRALFYLRDIRGGQGERATFRACLNALTPHQISQIAPYIAEYGRWDDILDFVDNRDVVNLVAKQLVADNNAEPGESISLLGKWLPSISTSSKKTNYLAKKWANALGINYRDYRVIVASLRARIGLLEHKMTKKEWSEIEYRKVPAQAFRKHIKAFKRNDEERFTDFISKVKTGEEKVNAATLFPYELLEQLTWQNESEIDALWNALPDWTQGNNALVMADTSGSMAGRPIYTAISLALYFAQRNEGAFKDYFMTFSGQPELVHVPNHMTLIEKVNYMAAAHWEQNTNLQAAFDSILRTALEHQTPEYDMPKTLYIISDMQFDASQRGYTTNFEDIKLKYAAAGYEMPTIVFWNVNAFNTEIPAMSDDGNVSLISGSSPSAFKLAVEGKTPLETMYDLLNSDRYNKIEV